MTKPHAAPPHAQLPVIEEWLAHPEAHGVYVVRPGQPEAKANVVDGEIFLHEFFVADAEDLAKADHWGEGSYGLPDGTVVTWIPTREGPDA